MNDNSSIYYIGGGKGEWADGHVKREIIKDVLSLAKSFLKYDLIFCEQEKLLIKCLPRLLLSFPILF
jgi:hypothetical protein